MAEAVDIAGILGGTRREIAGDVSWDEYRKLVALNPSTIVSGIPPGGSMRHLRYAWDHGRPDTDQMLWGRALHCLLFEHEEFAYRYRCWVGKRVGNAYKDFAASAWEDHAEVLPADGRYSMQAAEEAAMSFLREPLVQTLIRAGKAEQTIFEVEGNVQCRGRIDWISTAEDCIVDLKTTKAIQARLFGRDFYQYHYDVKLGLYRRWLSSVTGRPWHVQVIAIENSPPYDVAVIPIADAVLDRGAAKGLEVIARVEECIKTGDWPGIAGGDAYWLDTPVWQMDEELVEFDE